jgi:hypothetical protein
MVTPLTIYGYSTAYTKLDVFKVRSTNPESGLDVVMQWMRVQSVPNSVIYFWNWRLLIQLRSFGMYA